MVVLNTNNPTIPIQPINLYKREKTFRISGDWLFQHHELTPGCRHFIAQIERSIGEQGFVTLLHTTLAKKLDCHPNTVSRYARCAQELGLIIVIRNGRANTYMMNRHPWMGISDEEAKTMIPALPHKLLTLIQQIAYSDSTNCNFDASQTTENKQDAEPLESFLENHVDKDKEASYAYHTATTTQNTTTTSTSQSKDEEKELAFNQNQESGELRSGKEKELGTQTPKIQVSQSEEKETEPLNTVITSNTVTNSVLPTVPSITQTQAQTQAQTTKPQQNKPVKSPKGKFSYQIYVDYAINERKKGRKIDYINGLANYLLRTGLQDNQVAKFVAMMKENQIGGTSRVATPTNPISGSDNSIITTNNQKSSSRVSISTPSPSSSSTPSPSSTPSSPTTTLANDLEALQRATAIESLAATAWQTLTTQEKEQLVTQASSNLLEKQPEIYSQTGKEALSLHVKGLVKGRLGEMLYKANLSEKANCDDVLECLRAIGKERFEGLEDWEQGDTVDAKIEGIGYFYSANVVIQQGLLEEITQEIYLEMGIGEAAKV